LIQFKNVPRAKNEIDKCFQGNELSADVWLVRGNVYIQYFEYELERQGKDPRYKIRVPDAIIIANESFYRALELKSDIKPSPGLMGPVDGQLLTGEIISGLATQAMKNKDYAEAIRLLHLVTRSYRASTDYARFLAYAYLDLAEAHRAIGDVENYKKFLFDAAKLNMPVPELFLNLYNLYLQENDTIKCGEVLAQARKLIPDNLEIKGYELGYFAMTGDTVNLRIAAKAIFEETKTNVDGINFVVDYIVREYLLAEEMIEVGLAIEPENFDLLRQMAYRYFYEAEDYDKIRDAMYAARPIRREEGKAAEDKRNELWEEGVVWAEKAYNINKDDIRLNRMYNYMLLRLQKEIPEDLKERIDSFNKRTNDE
jgi:tetratricopeptide (TPR) repeat protein